ncbi:MAG: exodeoxyribonuclease VII large subunit, partial [Sandarakinorhabdus sp.]|nr:exodeoxyribonuclease VII large subunit [Sandarakinorhabdus sp.]
RLDRAAARLMAQRRERAEATARRLPPPRTLLALPTQRADELFDRLPRGLRASASFWRGRAERAGAALRPALVAGRPDAAGAQLCTAGAGLVRGARGVALREQARFDKRSARLRPLLLSVTSAKASARLGEAGRMLVSLGPDQVLKRGYALVLSPSGRLVGSAEAAKTESRLTIRFADGDTPVTTGQPAQGKLF